MLVTGLIPWCRTHFPALRSSKSTSAPLGRHYSRWNSFLNIARFTYLVSV